VLTVVVPTYNERDNVVPLLDRLGNALAGVAARVLVVDDSEDGTADVVRATARTAALPVEVLHRPRGHRTGGLGGAVLTGLQAAGTPYVVVMDGDLQHPPETVPALLEQARALDADVVVASRRVPGGSHEGLAGWWRRFVSAAATMLVRLLFRTRLRDCTDPMSGFFLVRRGALDVERLRPDGFKILLEILGRHARLRVGEVGFTFAERTAGASKAGLGQGLVFLRHLARLRVGPGATRLAAFLAVGASGLLPNLVATAVAVALGAHYVLAAALGTVAGATWNFALGEALVFRRRRSGSVRRRWLGYVALSGADVVVRVPVVAGLVEVLGVPVLAASALSIVAAGVLRFLVVDRWLYPSPAVAGALPPPVGTGPRTPHHPSARGPVPGTPLPLEAMHDVA
jgi:dolichol-phosphate mannosyltransferase